MWKAEIVGAYVMGLLLVDIPNNRLESNRGAHGLLVARGGK